MTEPLHAPQPTPPPSTAPLSAPAPAAAPAIPGVACIGIDDFKKVRLATGEVVEARAHPQADRLLILRVKIGERYKQIVSGIRSHYTPEQLLGKTIVVVDNLQPAKLRGEPSEGMLLAVSLPEGGYRLLTTDGPAPSGLQVS